MKLWLLTRKDGDGLQVYDCYDGHVISAPTEAEARAIAAERPGDEGKDCWLAPHMSECEHFGESLTDKIGTWLSDFHAG